MNKRYIDFVPKSTEVVLPEQSARRVHGAAHTQANISVGSYTSYRTTQPEGRPIMDVVPARQAYATSRPTSAPVARPTTAPVARPTAQTTRSPKSSIKVTNSNADRLKRAKSTSKSTRAPANFNTEKVFGNNYKKHTNTSRRPKYGEIEDFSEKFVKTDVEKRPLGGKNSASSAKAKKLVKSSFIEKTKEAAEKVIRGKAGKAPKSTPDEGEDADKIIESAAKSAKKVDDKLRLPRPQFVNTDKITKRPLSRTSRALSTTRVKKAPEPEKETTGVVTIINKPEQDSRVGLIVTIIITIILGAAAGTVAFLLLPK